MQRNQGFPGPGGAELLKCGRGNELLLQAARASRRETYALTKCHSALTPSRNATRSRSLSTYSLGRLRSVFIKLFHQKVLTQATLDGQMPLGCAGSHAPALRLKARMVGRIRSRSKKASGAWRTELCQMTMSKWI